MRKGSDEYTTPGKCDFRGAGEITDLVDNVLIVHRNKLRELKIQNGDVTVTEEPACTLTVAKQRNGEWEGKINLWYNEGALQYVSRSDGRPMPFLMQ